MWMYLHKFLSYIAEEMGVALKRSAFSPNIRDRMDHSCVIGDAEGGILAQAEHIPVHLGSFHVGLKEFKSWLDKRGEGVKEGDVFIVNDPYITGTHLNDVMLIAPVFYGGRALGFLANKAHHVSIGGGMPGGLNPFATKITDEGTVIPPTLIGERWSLNRRLLEELAQKVELPRVFIGDVSAQFASLYVGHIKLREVLDRVGLELFTRGSEKSYEYATSLSLALLRERLKAGTYSASDYLELPEGNVEISARVSFDGEVVKVSLQSPPQVNVPFNAVYGVSFSAVSTAIMFLLAGLPPVNHGFYSVIRVEAPSGSLLNAVPPAPVGAGNLETSMRVFDVVMRALSQAAPGYVPAAGSGTMMNLVFHGEGWVYYETIAGGSGGRPNGHGVSGVHSSMTNTLNTPVEVIEKEYPLSVMMYDIRRGSGGRGRFRGGDGVIRAYRALRETGFVIIGNRFRTRPWGLWGGEDGAPARAYVIRFGGRVEEINVAHYGRLEKGDVLVLMTPGGGGWGAPTHGGEETLS